MPVLQKRMQNDFTVVHNTFIRDSRLGICARGLLLTMLSMKEGWKFSIKGLAKILPDGERRISSGLKTLEDCGYLRRKRIYENGKVREWLYSFSDEPIFEDSEINIEPIEKETNNSTQNVESVETGANNTIQDIENLDLRNVDVGTVDLETVNDYQILSNQILYNQILYNQSINQSEQQNEIIKSDITNETDKIDRPEKMHFTDVLKHLGIENSYDIESEDELLYQGESERQVKKCEISYTLKSNKRAMIDALKYLFCYSYYIENGEFEKTTINLLDTVILSIADMISKDNIILQKSLVHYYEIIDCINKILPRLSLMDWFVSFEDKWTKILSENTIKYPKAYIKTCIWNWLNDFEFEEQNMLRAIR